MTATPTLPPPVLATPTPSPNTQPTSVMCELLTPLRIRITWVDQSTFETEFLIEVDVNSSGFALLTTVNSTTQATTGTMYTYDIPVDLTPNTDYSFRVKARNFPSFQNSDWSASSGVCHTGTMFSVAGCVEGQVYLQGQSEHGGVPIFVDGVPAGASEMDGSFQVCGVSEGQHTFSASTACYLPVEAADVTVEDDETTRLGFVALRGGDVTGDDAIDLFDLVRIAADYRSQPPGDPAADCNRDGTINLFDLVMVAANYDLTGPVRWGQSSSAATVQDAPPAGRPASDGGPDAGALVMPAGGVARGVTLQADAPSDSTVVVEIRARSVEGVYGADFTLDYDPERLKPIDALPQEPGIQAEPGAVWSDDMYVAVNAVDREQHRVRFAASLRRPADPLAGDVVIATVRFRAVGEDPLGAFGLVAARLSDRAGRPIGAHWTERDIVPDGAGPVERIYLPFAGTQRAYRRR